MKAGSPLSGPWSPSRAERSLLLRLGALILVLMLASSGVAAYLFEGLRDREEDRLSGAIAAILGESISRVSFSGKYHARLFVEEARKLVPSLAYISVESPDGRVIAHSDPSRNDSLVEKSGRDSLAAALGGEGPVHLERGALGGRYKEVLQPYRGGPGDAVQGVVRIGIAAAAAGAAQRANYLALLLLIGLLTAGAIWAALLLSRSFGGTLRALNQELERKVVARTEALERANGELFGANESLRDALDRLRATQDQLVRSEKLGILGQLAAGVAHELNTPLGAVSSATLSLAEIIEDELPRLLSLLASLDGTEHASFEAAAALAIGRAADLGSRPDRAGRAVMRDALIAAGSPDPEADGVILQELGLGDAIPALAPIFVSPRRGEILERLAALASLRRLAAVGAIGAEKAGHVVGALRAYLRNDRAEVPAPVDLAEGIGTVLALYGRQLRDGVELRASWTPGAVALGVKDRLEQVWINLINNAIQAMDGKGLLEVSTAVDGKEVEARFADSGPGIPPGIRAQIFEPFFSTKKNGGGLGLGLDICRRIVMEAGGRISFESEPGRTVFTVRLPRALVAPQA